MSHIKLSHPRQTPSHRPGHWLHPFGREELPEVVPGRRSVFVQHLDQLADVVAAERQQRVPGHPQP